MPYSLATRFVETGLSYRGHPSTPFSSRYMPTGPGGDMSCSGFVCFVADKTGLHRPVSKFTDRPVRTGRDMFYYWGFPVAREDAREGDLVFFSENGALVTRTGIYLGDGTYIYSPGARSGKISIARIDDFEPRHFCNGYHYYQRTRELFDVVFEQNPVGFNRIF